MHLTMSDSAAALHSSPEKTNGAKLNRLIIDGGRLALQKVFDSIPPPDTLQTFFNKHYITLQGLQHRRILNTKQWELLFPPPGAPPNSSNFDITLLFVLLRNICGFHPPATGWDIKPPDADKSLEANLARIKWFRNELYGHVTSTGIDVHLFNKYWTELSDTLVHLGLDQLEIDRLRDAPLDEDLYLELLTEWKTQEDDIKQQLHVIKEQLKIQNRSDQETHRKLEVLLSKVGDIDFATCISKSLK